ncbi:aminotransferase class I/II-fold pyridoxal phosphate-dependent enzyme [Laceyella putida]|uniref:Aminotransferase n=1 Tax=Laceyella putida TaxID=110101 RepID=A0ABW2RM53_9BACL
MNVTASQHIQSLKLGIFNELTQTKRRLAVLGKDLIDLSVGSPDLPPPDFIKEALIHYAKQDDAYGYTLGALPSFHHAVASLYERRYGVSLQPETEVLQLIGSQEGLTHLPAALINPGDVVLAPDPGYPAYEAGIRLAGGQLVPMPLCEENGYFPRLDLIPSEIAERAKLMFLNYPANPVTAVATLDFFKEVVRFAKKHHILVVHDYAYSELTFDNHHSPSFLSVPGAKEVGVEFNSLSKTFSMAGCRIAYMVGHPQVIRILATVHSNTHYGIFQPIQKAAEVALTEGEAYIREMNLTYLKRRDALVAELHASGWRVTSPPATMFVWAQTPGNRPSREFAFRLLEEAGVVLTPGQAFGENGEGYVRISLVQPEARLREAAARIGTFLAQAPSAL